METGAVVSKPGSSGEYKTGTWRRGKKPLWERKKCQHCAICFHFCPEAAILFKKKNMVGINYSYCKGCGICVEECPFGAIRMVTE